MILSLKTQALTCVSGSRDQDFSLLYEVSFSEEIQDHAGRTHGYSLADWDPLEALRVRVYR